MTPPLPPQSGADSNGGHFGVDAAEQRQVRKALVRRHAGTAQTLHVKCAVNCYEGEGRRFDSN